MCVTQIVFMKTDWVSVKDRLPGNDCRALVTDGRHVTVADWTRGEGWSLDRDDRNIGITSDVLTHWMPLPEPPVQPRVRGGNSEDLDRAISARFTELEALLGAMNLDYEDGLYRFYHQSSKVYALQGHTARAAEIFRAVAVAAGLRLNPWFEEIVAEGTGVEFDASHNVEWPRHARPLVEAFLHARYFVEMMVRYGGESEAPSRVLPSGRAAVRALFGL